MKSSKSLLIHGLVGISVVATATAASSRQALIYTLDQTSPQITFTESVSLDTAHLILDRRLGTQLKSSIGAVTEEIVDSLNKHGGVQRTLLADSSNDRTRKVLIALEGYDFKAEDASRDLGRAGAPTIAFKDAEDKDLYDEIVDSVPGERGSRICSFGYHAKSGLKATVKVRQLASEPCVADSALFNNADEKGWNDESLIQWIISYMTVTADEAFIRLSFLKNSNKDIVKFLSAVRTYATEAVHTDTQETTVLVLTEAANHHHRSTRKSNPAMHTRDLPEEEPLHIDDSFASITPAQASNTTYKPLPPNLQIPKCFTSEELCQSQTNDCSSHGSCLLLHSPNTGDDNSARECWSCSCRATKTSSSGGVTNWGGNACQKMDISVPFWLFVGFGVTMTALITGGIGMMWSMGSEELPGVLGAGVGGPRAQR